MPPPPPPPERRLLGVALRCLTATAFAAMGGLLKLASGRGASVPELVFYRSVGALPLVAAWVLLRGGRGAIAMRDPVAHLTRSGIGVCSMALTFTALALLPLPQATTLSYSSAIGATLLSALLLGERVEPRRWAAVVVGFVGVVLVARPFGGVTPLPGLAAGLLAAVSQAAVMITLRQIGRRETTSSIVFWFTLVTTAASALLLPWYGRWHEGATFAMLLGGGLLGGVGQLAMTASLRFAPVAVVAPFDYLQMLWATLIGWLWLASPTPPAMLLGAALIAGSGIYTAYREGRRGLAAAEELMTPEP